MFWMPKFVKQVFVQPDKIFEEYKDMYMDYKKHIRSLGKSTADDNNYESNADQGNDDHDTTDDKKNKGMSLLMNLI